MHPFRLRFIAGSKIRITEMNCQKYDFFFYHVYEKFSIVKTRSITTFLRNTKTLFFTRPADHCTLCTHETRNFDLVQYHHAEINCHSLQPVPTAASAFFLWLGCNKNPSR